MIAKNLSRMSASERRSIVSRASVDLTGATVIARTVIDRVRAGGDRELIRCAEEFDASAGAPLRVTAEQIEAAGRRVPEGLMDAMRVCKRRIERFHSCQSVEAFEYRDETGVYGQRVVPLQRVGAYVPGGSASYASSVLMACVPARVAGVEEIIVCTPAKDGKIGDAVLAAAGMCCADEVYAVGGAHAIAAMAYGTETIRPVQKIVGPGGAVVSAAKLLVRADCEIDFLAGPSEVLVVADDSADPRLVAAEMLAQLEHDPLARAVLVSTSERVLEAAAAELGAMSSAAPRREVIERSSEEGAVFLLAQDLQEAVGFTNDYAPEHLVIDVSSPEQVMAMVRNAGSVFLGRYSSVAFGDYCSGPNHILPTKGTASSRSSLSTYDFLKIIPYQSVTRAGAEALAPATEAMAKAEGLPGHAQAAALRRSVVG